MARAPFVNILELILGAWIGVVLMKGLSVVGMAWFQEVSRKPNKWGRGATS